MKKKSYLGDGAYVEDDGTQVKIYCDREGVQHEVYLEPEALIELIRCAQRWGLLNKKLHIETMPDSDE